MKESNWSSEPKTVVGYSTITGLFLYGGFGLAGLVLGYFLPQIITFALKLPWVPFEGPLKLINSLNGSWLGIALSILGLVAGLVIADIGKKEMLIVTITDKAVQLDRDGKTQVIAKKDMDTIFLDGKQLVILGNNGYELAREPIDETPKIMKHGFEQYGYPWSATGDPYRHAYRRWVLDDPAITPSANAILKTREKALEEKNAEEIKDLRNELAKIGYVVRDEKTRQYWRLVSK